MGCTGYTAKLVESGQSFPEFVITCARAMGACITMRDDDLDTPIPEKFEPSNYHVEALKRAQDELAQLEKMTDDERLELGEKRKVADIASYNKYLDEYRAQNARVREMIAKVSAWTPPTPDHVEFKKFMLEQLNVSIQDEKYYMNSIETAKNTSPMEYYEAQVHSATWGVNYHEKEMKGEEERVNNRNEWVSQLRASLKDTK